LRNRLKIRKKLKIQKQASLKGIGGVCPLRKTPPDKLFCNEGSALPRKRPQGGSIPPFCRVLMKDFGFERSFVNPKTPFVRPHKHIFFFPK
jgi:hypothetical protein